MKTIQRKEDKTRVICPKCKAFLFEVKPFLSEHQQIKAFCRKCKSKVEIN